MADSIYYFSKWKNEGLLEEIFDTLCGIVHRLSGRTESPSLGIIDSRSVRTPTIQTVKWR